jgi:prepilin-type N-terminal cleavage/methylation domain-containing protein
MAITGRTTEKSSHGSRGLAGFSLIEVMIAMVLLSIGLLAIGAAQLRALEYGADANDRGQATYLAQQQLDRFLALATNDLNLTFCQPAPGLGSPPTVADPLFPWGWCNDANARPGNPLILANTAGNPNAPGIGETTPFLRRWSIDQPGTIPGIPAGIYRITVQVRWNQTAADPANSTARMVQIQGFK